MIHIRINPGGVEKIHFVAASDLEDDFDAAAWRAIRPLVKRIDRRLRHLVRVVAAEAGRGAPSKRGRQWTS